MGRPARHADFFRVWTLEMAYVLGLWWAEGCMRIKAHGAHEFEIANNNRDHLERIAQVIGGNYDLRKVSQDSECYKVIFVAKRCIRISKRMAVRRASQEPSVSHMYRQSCCLISCEVSWMEMGRYRGMGIGRSFRCTPVRRYF